MFLGTSFPVIARSTLACWPAGLRLLRGFLVTIIMATVQPQAPVGSATRLLRHRRRSRLHRLPTSEASQPYKGAVSLGRAQDAQALLTPSQVCSRSAQIKAAAAYVQRLKRNQRKEKLILSLWGVDSKFASYPLSCDSARVGPCTFKRT
jgi:hypothetical protein